MDKDCKEQLTLFSDRELREQATLGSSRNHLHQMTSGYLQEWKAKIFRHQQQVRVNVPVEQIALFEMGETCRSNQRWKGVHDRKRYVENYQSLHYQHKMQTAVNIAFWWNAPVQTQPRQQLEQALIQTWRPPFNRESWLLWSAPFV